MNSVGRIVHYVPVYAPQTGDPEPVVYPAIIIRVLDGNGTVRLGMFGETGYTVVSPVDHVEPAEDGYPVAGAWFWPPRV
jgi:hypothetical protein